MKYLSMQAVVTWLGIASVVLFFMSITVFTGWRLTKVMQQDLQGRALNSARTLASQLVEPILVDDSYTVFRTLKKGVSASEEARYAYIRLKDQRIAGHTFDLGFPRRLLRFRQGHGEQFAVFRTRTDRMIDVSVPLLDGQLGNLHLGVSQGLVIAEQRRFILVMSVVLAATMMLTFVVTQRVGKMVGLPLQLLTEKARSVPTGETAPEDIQISGTAEVRALSLAFREMVRDLRRLESENKAAQTRMVSAERLAALGELAAGLAHEIMNPLDGVLEACRYLQREIPKNDRFSRYLRLMNDGLARIDRVMRQMLMFARAPASAPELGPQQVPAMIQNVLELAQGKLSERGIKASYSGDGNGVCICDRELTQQALLNLLLNAADASKDNSGPEIRISVESSYAWVEIHVDDNGPGVPEESKAKIFAPFFTTKNPAEGTGLGLTISRQAIQQCGGNVVLDDRPSSLGGARFTVLLPANGLKAKKGTGPGTSDYII